MNVGGSLRRLLTIRGAALARAATHVIPFVLAAFVVVEWNGIPTQDRDTRAYYSAATAPDHTAVYDPLPPPGPHEFTGVWHYLYPPPLAALLSFLPSIHYRTFDRLWLIANTGSLVLLGFLLSIIANGRVDLSSASSWTTAVIFTPGALLSVHFGNIEPMIIALVAAGLAFPRWGGFTIGCAAAFKVNPVWPLGFMLLRRPAAVLPGLLLAAAFCAAVCLAAYGLAGTSVLVTTWIDRVLPSVSQGQFWGESLRGLASGEVRLQDYFGNLSISFLPVQIAVLSGWQYEGGDLPTAIRMFLFVFGTAVPVCVGWLTRHRSLQVQAAAVFAAALFSAPIVRPYTLPVVLLVVAAVRAERRGPDHLTVEQRAPDDVMTPPLR